MNIQKLYYYYTLTMRNDTKQIHVLQNTTMKCSTTTRRTHTPTHTQHCANIRVRAYRTSHTTPLK